MISKDKLDLLKQQYLSVTNDINKPIDLEALEILTTKLGQNIPKEELEKMLKSVDQDGSGCIEFDEFVSLMVKKTREGELEMRDAFTALDRNKNGYISPNDLRHLLYCMGENYSLEEIIDLLKEIDEDGDGCINFQEFLKLMYEESQ